ncbi:hypothetical protein AOQ84DRAFT_375833 [Glonium stellatum]|uniref:Uncharacterized protein n=1 Tax=Glonium stellatum TaxID=574774 RepID=A0A8E2F2L5_9PEZI|nr:hypothetical protein AOQ84DRAFT_375833 [Glonium stellatum]
MRRTFFARHTLDQDYIQFLSKINNKAKARRKTKSDILEKARIMTYKDLKAARVKRAQQEAAKEAKGKGKNKGKRGRKPKSALLEPETEATAGEENAVARGAFRDPEARMW